jgi:hypothetical protein
MRLLLDGMTEDMISDLFEYTGRIRFSAREKAALHYADLFKRGEHATDKDQVYADLAKHFSDEKIIELGLFCVGVDGVGKFVKSLNVQSRLYGSVRGALSNERPYRVRSFVYRHCCTCSGLLMAQTGCKPPIDFKSAIRPLRMCRGSKDFF